MPRRAEQLTHALRDIAARFLLQEVEFGRGTLVTVTRAEITGSGHSATIFLSVLPEKYGTRVLRTVTKHLYDLQGRVNTSLGRRSAPRIRLALDPALAAR